MTTERQEPVESNSTPSRGVTQVGQVFNELERVTRRLPGVAARRARAARNVRPSPSREHIAALIEALGDASNPAHASAVDELAAIGPAAVPAICEALAPTNPWLTIYRAAEAAGRIGDGRAAGPLLQALNHPNSNVRWSAVRALTQIGDVRALIELRRVAQHDQGRTSWGEPVADAAESALAELNRRSVWGQSLELVKTAVTCVLMILALILAFSVVTRLRDELDRFGRVIPGQTQIPQFTLPTAAPTTAADDDAPASSQAPATLATTVTQPTAEPVLAPTSATIAGTELITGTVLQDANVRPFPGTDNQPIGRLSLDDEIIFLARSPNSQWYLIRLGERRSSGSTINSPDGTGWINQSLVSAPEGELPVQDPAAPTTSPSPTASP